VQIGHIANENLKGCKTLAEAWSWVSISQSIEIYFPSNNRKLQCNKCCSTWRATRKALRSFRLGILPSCLPETGCHCWISRWWEKMV